MVSAEAAVLRFGVGSRTVMFTRTGGLRLYICFPLGQQRPPSCAGGVSQVIQSNLKAQFSMSRGNAAGVTQAAFERHRLVCEFHGSASESLILKGEAIGQRRKVMRSQKYVRRL